MARTLTALLLLLTSCASPPAPPPPAPPPPARGGITVAVYLPQTGSAHGHSNEVLEGIWFAHEACGGRAGEYLVELAWFDYGSSHGWWAATENRRFSTLESIAESPDVVAVIGPFDSSAAQQALPIFERAGLVIVSPATSPAVFRSTGRNHFARVVPSDEVQASTGADWAHRTGARRVCILDDRMPGYGALMADRFEKRARETGLVVVARESVEADAEDFLPLMARIRSLKPDLVYCGGTTKTLSQLVWALLAADAAPRLLVPEGCREQAFIDVVGAKRAEGRCFFSSSGLPDEKVRDFYPEFAHPLKRSRDRSAHAVYGYEAARVVFNAISRAGAKDREAIRAAVLATRDFDSRLGRWSFDEHGVTTLKTTAIYCVRRGKFELLEMIE